MRKGRPGTKARGLLAVVFAFAVACEPPSPHPVPATRLPSVQEIAGRYEDQPGRLTLRRSLVLRDDGTFTFTTIDQEQVTRSVSGRWEARQIPASGALELKVLPFFMPDGKTPVASLSMPIETCGGVLCFTHSEAGVFVRVP